MPSSGNHPPFFSHRLIAATILGLGILVSIGWYRQGRADERENANAEFMHRASLRHALAREILSRFEDSLFGLSTLFTLDGNVTRTEFTRATTRMEARLDGAQAFEWVPVVTLEERAATEATLQRTYSRRSFEFIEIGPDGQRNRAAERPFYYPIAYIQPVRGNEMALGYDLGVGPTRGFLDRARESRQMVVTSQVRLVQETGNQLGVVMIWPVYRVPRTGAPQAGDVFYGFLQCVFRVHDLLETTYLRQPSTVLDMLFIDASEADPARRVLYYRPGDNATLRGAAPAAMEAEFRRGIFREYLLPLGGRDWRVLFRPRGDWFGSQFSTMPLLRSCSVLLLAGLIAGFVQLIGRRAETIRREVDERTAELAESRRQMESMLQKLPGMAYRASYEDQLAVIFVSEGAYQLTGWTAEDFMSGKIHYRDCIHPDDVARVRASTLAAVERSGEVEVEYRIRPKTGPEKWALARGRGAATADGSRKLFEGLVIDITAQKDAERARLTLERKLLEGQKLESLGLLAGGIAHDFNNLLSAILGNASLVRLELPADTPVDPPLRGIETAAMRAAELCRQMLAYAGKGRFVIEPVNLTALVEDLLALLNISVGQHATLRLQLERALPAVLADATQLSQIVMNLVLNGADAIGAGTAGRSGEITLKSGVMHADGALLATSVAEAGLAAGEYVFLEVRDTGCGMTPEVRDKIFDPFFTTKAAGRGLGLAAVLGIVRSHGGALQVESRPGAGSTFRLLLPPAPDRRVPLKTVEAASAVPWRHEARVLMIEDEEPVREMTVAMLKTFGLSARGAASGPEGIEIFRRDPAAFALVLLDLQMPGMSGEQTLEALRATKPDVPVLLVSGYSEGDLLRRLRGAGPLGFVAKPFTRDALMKKLREFLDRN